MKHKKLWILVTVCLIIFIGSMTAGIILAANSAEWDQISTGDYFYDDFNDMFKGLAFSEIFRGEKISRSIDKSFTASLTDIQTVKISGVSEKLTVGLINSDQVQGRLFGNYTAYREMDYVYEIKGSMLHIYPDYPVFGLFNVNISQVVMIPEKFDGHVEINTVSGTTTINDLSDSDWSSLSFKGVSGSLECDAAAVAEINFENISGQVRLNGCAGRVVGKTVSGDIQISWQSFTGGRLDTVSGGISLKLPVTASCKLIFDSVSGDINNQGLDFKMVSSGNGKSSYVLNEGQQTLEVETVSGNLRTEPAG